MDRRLVDVLGLVQVPALGPFGEDVADGVRVLVDQGGQLVDRFVEVDQALAVLLEAVLQVDSRWYAGFSDARGGSGIARSADGREESVPWPGGNVHFMFDYRGRHYVIGDAHDEVLSTAGLFELEAHGDRVAFRAVMLLPDWPDDVRTDGASSLLLVGERAGVIDLSEIDAPRWLGCFSPPPQRH